MLSICKWTCLSLCGYIIIVYHMVFWLLLSWSFLVCIGIGYGGLLLFYYFSVYSIDMILIIVFVDTISYIWCFMCLHLYCDLFRYYFISSFLYPMNISTYVLILVLLILWCDCLLVQLQTHVGLTCWFFYEVRWWFFWTKTITCCCTLFGFIATIDAIMDASLSCVRCWIFMIHWK